MTLTRRDLIRLSALVAVGGGLGAGTRLVARGAGTASGFGPLGPPDADGVRLPDGFGVRVIGRTGEVVAGTEHVWHAWPDGGACFATDDGGWVYVSNSELDAGRGGVSAVRFADDGEIVDAYSIARGTNRNCSGGATSWGTWLSCEEVASGLVHECDPLTADSSVARPALGRFTHEAVAEDRRTGILYLTEDLPDGRLYRFVPARAGDLTAGRLEAASVADVIAASSVGSALAWLEVSPASPDRSPATTAFNGGEGVVVDGPTLFVTTKGDDRIWAIDLIADSIRVFYDGRATPSALLGLDQIVVHPSSRDLFVVEDGGNMEVVQIVMSVDGGPESFVPFLQFADHGGSEVTGPAFSPDGMRFYVSSQRGRDGLHGLTVEVTGRFPSSQGAATVSGRHPAIRIP